jgi:AAA domain
MLDLRMNFHPRSDWPDAAEIAKALGGKKSGKGYSCRCPAHNDKSPSLSVTDAGDGRVLLKCHTGCSQEDVMDALRDRGLFGGGGATCAPAGAWLCEMTSKANGHAKPLEESWGPWALVDPPYEYTDFDGTLLYRVVRKERVNAAGEKEKTFLQRQPDGTWTQGDRRVLYRWPELIAHPDATLFVCEGEKDADRVASLGHCATTVANGNWNGVDVACAAGRDVLILEDNDKAGREKALKSATALQGVAASIRIVSLPGLPEKGDVSDWLDGDPANADNLPSACFAAPLWRADHDLRFVDMSNWHKEPVPERQWAVEDRIPLRQVYLLSGNGGEGKSLVELMRAVAHVLGKDWLGIPVRQGPAIYLSAEDDEDELHIRLDAILRHYGATYQEVVAAGLHLLDYAGEECIPDKEGVIRPTALFKKLEGASSGRQRCSRSWRLLRCGSDPLW